MTYHHEIAGASNVHHSVAVWDWDNNRRVIEATTRDGVLIGFWPELHPGPEWVDGEETWNPRLWRIPEATVYGTLDGAVAAMRRLPA